MPSGGTTAAAAATATTMVSSHGRKERLPLDPSSKHSKGETKKKKKKKKTDLEDLPPQLLEAMEANGVVSRSKKKKRRPKESISAPNLSISNRSTTISSSSAHNSQWEASPKAAATAAAATHSERLGRSLLEKKKKSKPSKEQQVFLETPTIKKPRRREKSKPKKSPKEIPIVESSSPKEDDRSKSRSSTNRSFRKARSLFGALKAVSSHEEEDNATKHSNGSSRRRRALLRWAKKKIGNNNNNNNNNNDSKHSEEGLTLLGNESFKQGFYDTSDHNESPQKGIFDNSDHNDLLGWMEENDNKEIDDHISVGPLNDEQKPKSNTQQYERSASTGSGLNSIGTLDNSQELPPVTQIIPSSGADGDISDIGELTSHDRNPDTLLLDPEVIDGVTFIYLPSSEDVVYGDRGHPGTKDMIGVLRGILEESQDEVDFSPKVYKAIKKKLKGRKFLLRADHPTERTSWKEATKGQNIRMLGEAFEEEKRRKREGIEDSDYGDGNDSEISLEGSAKEPSTFLEEEKPQQPDIITIQPLVEEEPIENKATPRHENREKTFSDPLETAISKCLAIQESMGLQGEKARMHQGIAVEKKLLSLIAMTDTDIPETKGLQNQLMQIEELTTRIKYISIAPLFEKIEEIEKCVLDHLANPGKLDEDFVIDDDGMSEKSSFEKSGDVYTISMNGTSDDDLDTYEDDIINIDDAEVETLDEDEDEVEEDDDEDEDSRTNLKEGHILSLHEANQDLSSVGESGIYDSSSSEEYDSDEDEVLIDITDDGENEYENNEILRKESTEDELSSESHLEPPIVDKPNPKLQQFFDRLAHLFETRKRIQDRAKSIHGARKCVKIKAKAHSGGIRKHQGKYKKEYQQHGAQDRLVRNLDDLYDAAQHAQNEFESFLKHLVANVGGLDENSLILSPLKPRDRAFDKAKVEYSRRSPGPPESWLYDIVRAGIICKTTKQLVEVNAWLTKNAHLVQAKNRFSDPVFNGYRDLLYHVSIPYQDGLAHVCEIQVHHKDIYVMNDQFGTIKHYDFFRSCFANPWRSQDDILSDLAMMNTYSKIEGPLMKRLLKSEDPEQLRLFAGLFKDKLDEFDRSLELYRRLLNLQETTHGSDHEDMASTYLSIGLVLGALGDTDQSLLNLLKALAIQESFLGTEHVEVANSYVEIGHMLAKRGDYSGAYTQYQRALQIRENKLPKDHFLIIKSLQEIGLVLQQKCDFRESEKTYRKALKIQEGMLGDSHLDVALTHSLIGETLCLYGEHVKAMAEYRLALSAREKGLGKNHPTAAESHTAMGVLLLQRGDLKTSRWHHTKALRIRESMLGKDDEACARSHRYLGDLLSRYGDYPGAILELKRAHEIMEATVGMDHSDTAGAYIDLGNIHCRHGQYENAIVEYRRAMVIRESIFGSDHPDTAITYMYIGKALHQKGDTQEALVMHRKTLIIFQSVLGDAHTLTAIGYEALADALCSHGKMEQSLKEHRRVLRIRRSILVQDHPDVSGSCSKIGHLLLRKDSDVYDPIGALGMYRLALSTTVGRCGNIHPETATVRCHVAFALIAMAENVAATEKDKKLFLNEARDKLRESISLLKRVDPSIDTSTKTNSTADSSSTVFASLSEKGITGRAYIALGSLLAQRGKEEDAHDSFTEGIERLSAVLDANHPEVVEAERKLMLLIENNNSG